MPTNAKPLPLDKYGKPCVGCWTAKNKKGTWITYRPAGQASGRTNSTTATVEINNEDTFNKLNLNKGRPERIKLKFPKTGAAS